MSSANIFAMTAENLGVLNLLRDEDDDAEDESALDTPATLRCTPRTILIFSRVPICQLISKDHPITPPFNPRVLVHPGRSNETRTAHTSPSLRLALTIVGTS
jgi:hypothetical protein